MPPTKEQRREKILQQYAPLYCQGCGKEIEKGVFSDGRLLCAECLKKEMAVVGEDITHKIYYLLERLATANRNTAPGIVWDIWSAIHPTKVVVNPGIKENYYHILLDAGEIVLNESESMTPLKFRMEFQRLYGIVLPNLPYTKWSVLLSEWLRTREEKEAVEEISEEQELIDAVLENLTSSQLVKGIGGARFGIVFWHNGELLVPNSTIKGIATKINRNLRLRRVSSILEDYLVGPSKTYRTPEGVVRMWRFNAERVGINTEEAIEIGDKEEDEDV